MARKLASIFLVALVFALAGPGRARAIAQGTVFDGIPIPAPGYAKALEAGVVHKTEVQGLGVRVTVIPDLYRYRMAVALERLSKSGYSGTAMERELAKAHAEHKKSKKRAGLRVRFETVGDDHHFFLQKKLHQHIKAKGGGSMTGAAADVKPSLTYAQWTVFAGSAVRKFKLAYFKEIDFFATLRVKNKKPIKLRFVDLLRYVPVKQSEHDRKGINVQQRQISHGNFKDLALDPVEFELFPAQWKLPSAPKGFEKIIAKLNGGK